MIEDNKDQSVINILWVMLFSYNLLIIMLYISQWLSKSTWYADIKELLFHNFIWYCYNIFINFINKVVILIINNNYDKYFLILFYLLNLIYINLLDESNYADSTMTLHFL